MLRLLATLRVGLIDMRGDLRRFGLLIACLAVGTALIAGVSSVGASIRQAEGDGAADAAGCACYQGDATGERLAHGQTPSVSIDSCAGPSPSRSRMWVG